MAIKASEGVLQKHRDKLMRQTYGWVIDLLDEEEISDEERERLTAWQEWFCKTRFPVKNPGALSYQMLPEGERYRPQSKIKGCLDPATNEVISHQEAEARYPKNT